MKNIITTIFGILTLATSVLGLVNKTLNPEQGIMGSAAGIGLVAAKDATNKKD